MADLFSILKSLVNHPPEPLEKNAGAVGSVIALVNRNNPQWDDNEVEMYARAVYKVAPKIFSDPVLVESVLKKIMLYGGIDPALMKELAELNSKMSGFPQPSGEAKKPQQPSGMLGALGELRDPFAAIASINTDKKP